MCRQAYIDDVEAAGVATAHAALSLLKRACRAWQDWLHDHQRPKAAAAHRAQQHHQAARKHWTFQASIMHGAMNLWAVSLLTWSRQGYVCCAACGTAAVVTV